MTVSTIASATLELSQIATYYVPGMTGTIQQARFNDTDADGVPEILVSDGSDVALYSSVDNSTRFIARVDNATINHDVIYDDINSDLIPDILIGSYFQFGAFESDTVCRLEFYDGIYGFAVAESLYFEADIDFSLSVQSPSSFVAFKSTDITGDGYNDLFFSFDNCRLTSFFGNNIQVTTGQTSLYSDFPGGTNFTRNALLKDIQTIQTPDGPIVAGTRYYNLLRIPGENRVKAWVEMMTGEGDSLVSISETAISQCSGDSAKLVSTVELMCAGDIHRGSDDPDVLVKYHWHQTCYEDEAVSFDESQTSLRLYRIGAPDDIELLWSDLTPEVTDNFYYSGDFSGFFFSASGGTVRKHSGLNGGEVDISEPIDADTIIWRSGANLRDGDMVAIKNQILTVYTLGSSTDVDDNSLPASIPLTFALSHPHPNPFNSSCVIEYSLPRRAHTVITVHNVLGQEVTTLIDEVRPAGEHATYWNGKDQYGNAVASGIYLYRMTAGEYIESKKLVLIK